MIYICYNNQSFGNTGHQRASSTLHASYTSTTPVEKVEVAKDMLAVRTGIRKLDEIVGDRVSMSYIPKKGQRFQSICGRRGVFASFGGGYREDTSRG